MNLQRRAVVTNEEDQRLFLELVLAERIDDLPHTVVTNGAEAGIFESARPEPFCSEFGFGPERGFVSRTSAGILLLLGFLVLMNLLAIVLRSRFERKW